MKIDEFLGRLEGVEKSGDGWVARCPAHGDKHPSLSVTAKGGKILVHCHVGCSSADVVSAMGLEMKDLFEDAHGRCGGVPASAPSASPDADPLPPKKKSGSHGKWVCDYLYHDADGNLLYKATRYAGANGSKTFTIKHADSTAPGGWVYGLKAAGLPRVIYHLPDVIAAGKAGRTVIVAEGEKDVDNLRSLGFCATCNVGGAGKWGYQFPADWGHWFDGVKQVLVIADNDPATKMVKRYDRHQRKHVEEERPHLVGQKHAWSVMNLLRASGYKGDIKLMVMPDVGEVHPKDFTDWLEAVRSGGAADDAAKAAFKIAVKGAAEWPACWHFTENDVAQPAFDGTAVAPAEKGGRDTALDMPEVGTAEEGAGRFGRQIPRAPETDVRTYKVGFRTGGYRAVGLTLNRDEMWVVQKDVNAAGEEVTKQEWRKVPLPMMVNHAMWMVMDSLGKGGKMSAKMQSDVASIVCMMWLRSRGKFFWDENSKGFATSLFFDETTGVLMRVRSDEFMAFLATVAEINRESSGFKYLMALIDDAAMSDEVARGVVPSNMWDRRGDAVYVSSGDAEMYRLKDGRVDLVQNGTDGVLFMRGKTLAPWKLQSDGGVDPFATAKIFTGASWADKMGCMNVRLWVLNLFACHQTKPILLITGLAQSGKTRMAKAIKEILGVRQDGRLDLSVQQVEDGDKGLDAFWATVNDGKLEVFDNLDTKIKWVGDALQNVATDGQTKRRTLYTTFGVSILRANANIILTSNNPLFSTAGAGGMADRLISINLHTNRSASMDTELSQDIAENRDRFMTWIVRTVAAAMVDTAPVDKAINRRHPDFGIFSVRCGRAFGNEPEVVQALGAAEAEKCLLPLRNDLVAREILRALEKFGGTMRFTSGDMSARIIAMMDDEPDEKTKAMFSARKVGKTMSKYMRQFETIFRMSPPRILDGKTVYESFGFTSIGALQVGQVGLEGENAETRIEAEAHGSFAENAPTNPLDPLDAESHARARPASLFSREEKIEDKSIEDDDGMEVDDGLEF